MRVSPSSAAGYEARTEMFEAVGADIGREDCMRCGSVKLNLARLVEDRDVEGRPSGRLRGNKQVKRVRQDRQATAVVIA